MTRVSTRKTAVQEGSGRSGRRPGKTATREQILDAAEEIFAGFGYEGASVRRIAERASVNQALVHHYFGSKEGLFQAIYLRRGRELARRRMERLDALERMDAPPTLEAVVAAYFVPAYELKKEGPGGLAFMQLQARVGVDSRAIPNKLREEVYDEPMRRLKGALSRVLPELEADVVYWRMIFAIGSYLYAISDAHRIEAISDGLCNLRDLDVSLEQLCGFIAGGFRGG